MKQGLGTREQGLAKSANATRQAQRELNAAREFVEAFSRTPMLAVGVALMTRRQFGLTAGRAKKLIAEQLMREGVISAADTGKKL